MDHGNMFGNAGAHSGGGFTVDHVHGGGSGGNFNVGGSGTFHGSNGGPDVHVGGNLGHGPGGFGGGVSGGVDVHPTPGSTLGVGGSVNSGGGYQVGVHGGISW